jgi:hypothetical protein
MPLPEPEPGLVIPYAYLWWDQARAGEESGWKIRPCAIVIMQRRLANALLKVSVSPISHAVPRDPRFALEIPARIKRSLGLDDERSWVVLNEFNQFIWPGVDQARVPGRPGDFAYGVLPPTFFNEVLSRLRDIVKAGHARVTDRD